MICTYVKFIKETILCCRSVNLLDMGDKRMRKNKVVTLTEITAQLQQMNDSNHPLTMHLPIFIVMRKIQDAQKTCKRKSNCSVWDFQKFPKNYNNHTI